MDDLYCIANNEDVATISGDLFDIIHSELFEVVNQRKLSNDVEWFDEDYEISSFDD